MKNIDNGTKTPGSVEDLAQKCHKKTKIQG